jgi:uncharacterized ParB-like nuclease family protein
MFRRPMTQGLDAVQVDTMLLAMGVQNNAAT